MARKEDLRKLREGTVINVTSKQQESQIVKALLKVVARLRDEFGTKIQVEHLTQWYLKDIVAELRGQYPDVEFDHHLTTSSIRPDGGILRIHAPGEDHLSYPILIAEAKNQGTNDLRAQEGLPKQGRGNAVERLGKNVIGLRAALMRESIFPFVCFGYGCDFADGSSILDRVTVISMFGHLNRTYLHNEGGDKFNRGSFYFRCEEWSIDEMADIMHDIARRSVLYYFSKYGDKQFKPTTKS